MPATTNFGYSFVDGSAYGVTSFAAALSAASDGDTLVANAFDAYKSPVWPNQVWTITKSVRVTGAGVLKVNVQTGYTTGIVIAANNVTFDNFILTVGYAGVGTTHNFAASAGVMTIKNLVIIGAYTPTGIQTSATGTGTINIVNCFLFGCQINFYTNSANVTQNVVNTTVLCHQVAVAGIYAAYQAVGCLNCVSVGVGGYGSFYANVGGSLVGTVNASQDASAPGAGAIHLHDSDPKFWRDQGLSGYGALGMLDFRVAPGSCLENAGSDTTTFTADLDILGNARHATTPTIGCFEVWAPPVVPDASVIKLSDTTGRALAFPGATVTGTYAAAVAQAATPTGFSLASGGDGLTWTLAFTSAETTPSGYVYLSADNTLKAVGLNGEKIRGLTNGASYKLKVTAPGKTLSEYSNAASAASLTANYSAGAGNIRDGVKDRVDGTEVTGTAGGLSINVVIPAPVPVSLGASETTIYTCPANYAASVKILRLCNTDSSARTATIYKVKSGDSAADDVTQAKTLALGAAGSDTHIFEDGPYTLAAGDKLSGLASSESKVTATAEVVEVTA
jgi:hypothetical protein